MSPAEIIERATRQSVLFTLSLGYSLIVRISR